MLDRTRPQALAADAAWTAPSLEISVISLPAATRRRALIETTFADLPHAWSFFDAHTGLQHPALRYDAGRIRRSFGHTLTQPQLAVWSSHYSVIDRFLEQGTSDYLLVFEDDVIFDTAFPLNDLLSFCQGNGIDYIRLFGMYAAKSTQLSFLFDRAVIRYKSSPLGAQAYLLSRAGAAKMVAACRDVDTSIDIAMDSFWKTDLPIYSVFPFPVIERFSPSSIPMQQGQPLGAPDKAVLTARRVRRKLDKFLANAALMRRDRQIRRAALDFVQVGEEHLRTGG
ncbi:glycosyltransferase family 25 protein [Psychromarinibacter sp. C21-152]|uniref:Glycosyltransferase family 25 protein n=1 Tax=Psychromarinibacter sediminicola TaxID=3033385 RepID=A0AAE3TAL1_9RHOB|nr:glycosyltransferase family 25 protein [Psychromarinibacter sediminicola]MDF0602094.1 glycosyltransferase family 25 protein [Psychromarinibacter sediminicola]